MAIIRWKSSERGRRLNLNPTLQSALRDKMNVRLCNLLARGSTGLLLGRHRVELSSWRLSILVMESWKEEDQEGRKLLCGRGALTSRRNSFGSILIHIVYLHADK